MSRATRYRRRHQWSFFTPSEPAFWVFTGMLAVGLVITAGEQEWFRRISPSGWALSWVLILVYTVPVLVLLFLLDRFEGEPLSMLAAAIAWGGAVAAALAGLANEGWGLVVERVGGPEYASVWTAALTAPFVEETLKLCGVVLLVMIARNQMDDVMDGFIYGALVGLGFAIVEDVFYFMAVFGGTSEGILTGFFIRISASGLYGHILFAGLAGLGVAYFIRHERRFSFVRRIAVAGGLFVVAVAAHFLWNSPLLELFPEAPFTGADWLLVPIAIVAKALPLAAFVGMAVVLSHRRERRWLRDAEDTAACADVMSPEQVVDLCAWGGARRARRVMRMRAGPGAAKVLGRLQSAQVDLAMLRTRSGSDDDPAVVRQRNLCRALLDALSTIPGAAPARTIHPSAGG